MDREVKPWRCKGGHVLGLVMRNGAGIRQLLLYREAVPISNLEIENSNFGEVDVMAVVEGYAADVRCSICGRMRTWVPGEEAIRRLLSKYQVEG